MVASSASFRRLTLRTVFIWAFLLSLASLAVHQSTSIDSDFWWHLKTGQYIVQTHTIPHVDPFSFTRGGSRWLAHEWLSEVIIYLTYSVFSWPGLLILFAAVITAALGICYWQAQGKPYIAALAVFLAALASAPLFGLRPQMFTFLLASLFIAVLRHYGRDEGKRHILSTLPVAMLLWVNLHAGFAIGLALILLFVAAAAIEREWTNASRLLTVLLICIAVVPVNPNGWRMFFYPFETLSSPAMQTLIQEWLSPDFHQVHFLPFVVLMFATFVVLATCPTRPVPGEVFVLVVLSLAALRSGRNIPIFALFAAPLFARYFSQYVNSREWKSITIREGAGGPTALVLNAALLLLPVVVTSRRIVDFVAHEETYEARGFPLAATRAISEQRLPGPIFNDYNWGGYLIWKLYPEQKVFIDGRADVYGDAFVFDYFKTYRGESDWRSELDRFGVRTVLIQPNTALATLLRQDSAWRTAFEDGQAVVFTRV